MSIDTTSGKGNEVQQIRRVQRWRWPLLVGLAAILLSYLGTAMVRSLGANVSPHAIIDGRFLGTTADILDAAVVTDGLPNVAHEVVIDEPKLGFSVLRGQVDSVLYQATLAPVFDASQPACVQLADYAADFSLRGVPPEADLLLLVVESMPEAEYNLCPWTAEIVAVVTPSSSVPTLLWPEGELTGQQWGDLMNLVPDGMTPTQMLVNWFIELDAAPQASPTQLLYESTLGEAAVDPADAWYDLPADKRPLWEGLTPQEVLDQLIQVQAFIEIDTEARLSGWRVEVRSSLGISHAADLAAGHHQADTLALPGERVHVLLIQGDAAVGQPETEIVIAEFDAPDSDAAPSEVTVPETIHIGPIGAAALQASPLPGAQLVPTRWITRAQYNALIDGHAETGTPGPEPDS